MQIRKEKCKEVLTNRRQGKISSFGENSFEKLRFYPCSFDNVLLNNSNDPDENIFNNVSQIDSVFYAVEEAATSFKKFNDKTSSLLHLN